VLPQTEMVQHLNKAGLGSLELFSMVRHLCLGCLSSTCRVSTENVPPGLGV